MHSGYIVARGPQDPMPTLVARFVGMIQGTNIPHFCAPVFVRLMRDQMSSGATPTATSWWYLAPSP
jgi:hypothetical protein